MADVRAEDLQSAANASFHGFFGCFFLNSAIFAILFSRFASGSQVFAEAGKSSHFTLYTTFPFLSSAESTTLSTTHSGAVVLIFLLYFNLLPNGTVVALRS